MHGFERSFMNYVVATVRQRRTTLTLQLNRNRAEMIKKWVWWNFFEKKHGEEIGVRKN